MYYIATRTTDASTDSNTHHANTQGDFGMSDPDKTGQIDVLNDPPEQMTFGRRLALHLSRTYAWYNPQLTESHDSIQPSIERAWAFFEHVTLERHIVVEQEPTTTRDNDEKAKFKKERIIETFHKGANRKLNVAEPGEMDIPTELYSPLTTPLKQMGDFGLGYGLYFSTLRAFALLSLCAALLNIPNLAYFQSKEYSAGQSDIPFYLKGSAICTERSWVLCPTCDPAKFESKGAYKAVRVVGSKGFKPNKTIYGGGDYLNITRYLDWDGINSVLSNSDNVLSGKTMQYTNDQLFSTESTVRLYQDYGIQLSERHNIFDWSPSTSFTFDDIWCQVAINVKNNTAIHCYLHVGEEVPFGDVSTFNLVFAFKNDCGDGATMHTGMINYATLFLFIVGALLIRRWESKLVVEFDEDEQTAQDYSIAILNPPPDAHDPEEWKRFFENNFDDCKVTVCTVVVDNDVLMSNMVQRREILRQLELKLPLGVPQDVTSLKHQPEKGIAQLRKNLRNTNRMIWKEMRTSKERPTTDVFVTFETEAAQRDVLRTLTVGALALQKHDSSCLPDPKFLFRGRHILDVQEPEEPSTIRWQELHASRTRMSLSLFVTSCVTLLLVIPAWVVISVLYIYELPSVASIFTSVCTFVFPFIARIVMKFEMHRSESSRQKWLFIKVAVFNILITSVLVSVINPFTATLDENSTDFTGLIPMVNKLFFSQIILPSFFQLADIPGNLQRHVFAPRAKTQEEMNMNFLGQVTHLAERYGNVMKFVFLMIWYCAIYPAAFFMGFLSFTVVYFVDRFSLMRTWARTPQLGTQIFLFVSNGITPIAVVLMSVLSAYAWSGFPYDNLCLDEKFELPADYVGKWTVEAAGRITQLIAKRDYDVPADTLRINISEGAKIYTFCNQDFRSYIGRHSFPPIPKFQIDDWMTDEQAELLDIYGWTCVAILVVALLLMLSRIIVNLSRDLHGKYEPCGKDMGIKFSEVPVIDSYIPQVQSDAFPHPLILCDVGEIDPKLFNWKDPDRSHSYYDVTQDVKVMTKDGNVPQNIFSRVKYWQP